MQRKDTNVDDLSEDSLRRAEETLARLAQTRQQAAATLEALHEQGEKLDKTQEHVDIIFEEQSFARRHLRSIASVFGSFANRFYSTPEETLKEQQKQEQIQARKDSAKQAAASKSGLFAAEAPKQAETSKPSQHKLRQTDYALDQMFDQVQDLRAMTDEMKKESEAQVKRLDVLNETTAEADQDMRVLIRQVRTVRNK